MIVWSRERISSRRNPTSSFTLSSAVAGSAVLRRGGDTGDVHAKNSAVIATALSASMVAISLGREGKGKEERWRLIARLMDQVIGGSKYRIKDPRRAPPRSLLSATHPSSHIVRPRVPSSTPLTPAPADDRRYDSDTPFERVGGDRHGVGGGVSCRRGECAAGERVARSREERGAARGARSSEAKPSGEERGAAHRIQGERSEERGSENQSGQSEV